MPKAWENKSGLPDPTSYEALKHIRKEEQRITQLVHVMRDIASLAGFEIINRIEFLDKRTGEIHK